MDPRQPDQVGGNSAQSRRVELIAFKGPIQLRLLYDSMKYLVLFVAFFFLRGLEEVEDIKKKSYGTNCGSKLLNCERHFLLFFYTSFGYVNLLTACFIVHRLHDP